MNRGSTRAAPCTLNLRLSPSAEIVTVADPLLAWVGLPEIGAGQTYAVSQRVTVPQVGAGSQYVWAVVDTDSTAGQLNELNDYTHIPFTVTGTTDGRTASAAPSFNAAEPTMDPARPEVGRPVTFSIRLTNTGSSPVEFIVQLNLWHPSGGWTPAKQLEKLLTLQAGRSTHVSWTTELDTPGTWGYRFIVHGHAPGSQAYLLRCPEAIHYFRVSGGTEEQDRSQGNIEVLLDDEYLSFDTPPMISNGRTIVPVRRIGEALGAEVRWEPATQTAYLVFEDAVVRLRVNDRRAYINDREVILDEPARIVGGRILVPIRFLSELRESVVDWDSETRTVIVRRSELSPDQLTGAITQLKDLWQRRREGRVLPSSDTTVARMMVSNLVERSDQLYFMAEDYSLLAIKTLCFAQELLNRGAYDMASRYLDAATRYEKLSYEFYKASWAVFQQSQDIAEDLLIIKGAQLGIGIAVGALGLGLAGVAVTAAFSTYINYEIDTQVKELTADEAWRNALIELVVKAIFQVPAVRDAVSEPVTGYIGRESGLYQKLAPIISSPEVKAEVMSIIGNSAEWAILKAAQEDAEVALEFIVDNLPNALRWFFTRTGEGGEGSW